MNRGADRITIGGSVLYALFAKPPGCLRLRLSADEWEGLGISVGARVDVTIPGELRAAYFVRSAVYVDPGWQWVECVPAPAVIPRAVGSVRGRSRYQHPE